MNPLLHSVLFVHSHAKGCRNVFWESQRQKFWPAYHLHFFNYTVHLLLACNKFLCIYFIWSGLAALIVGHSCVTKKKHGKGYLLRPFGHKETFLKQKIITPSFWSSKSGEQVCELIEKNTPKLEHVQVVNSLMESIQHELLLDVVVNGYSYANPFVDAPLARVGPESSVVVNIDLVKYQMVYKGDLEQHKKFDSTTPSESKNIIRRIKKCLVSKHGFKLRWVKFTDSARAMLNAPVQHGSLHERRCIQTAVNNTLPIVGLR